MHIQVNMNKSIDLFVYLTNCSRKKAEIFLSPSKDDILAGIYRLDVLILQIKILDSGYEDWLRSQRF